jgi:cyclopropane fatty-acyl-phospholipid synthase-like methyltransferase
MTTVSNEPRKSYIPALRFHALTKLYDRVIGATLKEDEFRRRLLEQARIRPGHRVLDLGCGTGTFAVLVKQSVPEAEVIGLDGDENVLSIAREKARVARVEVDFRRGMAFDPPFESGSFDRITSTLVFHHLTTAQKLETLERARGLLRPGGEIHITDWGAPQNALMRIAFLGVRLLDGFETTADNAKGLLPALMRQAGFDAVTETHREMTAFGTLAMIRSSRLEAPGSKLKETP